MGGAGELLFGVRIQEVKDIAKKPQTTLPKTYCQKFYLLPYLERKKTSYDAMEKNPIYAMTSTLAGCRKSTLLIYKLATLPSNKKKLATPPAPHITVAIKSTNLPRELNLPSSSFSPQTRDIRRIFQLQPPSIFFTLHSIVFSPLHCILSSRCALYSPRALSQAYGQSVIGSHPTDLTPPSAPPKKRLGNTVCIG